MEISLKKNKVEKLFFRMMGQKSITQKNQLTLRNLRIIKILGIKKGTLTKGHDADLCVIDINKPWVVEKNKLKSKSKNTPIENRKLQGQVLKTFIKGDLSYESGRA